MSIVLLGTPGYTCKRQGLFFIIIQLCERLPFEAWIIQTSFKPTIFINALVASSYAYYLYVYVSHNLMTSLDYLLINWSQCPLLLLMEEEQVILVMLWKVDPVKQVMC